MKNILILGVSSAQCDAVQKLKEMGYFVHTAAKSADGPGASASDAFVDINIIDKERIAKYIMQNNIDIVYSVGSDLAMPTVSKVSEDLGLKHFVSYKTAEACNKKNVMRNLTRGLDGSVPFEIVSSIEQSIALPYPVFVKPADSQGQRGISLVKDEDELDSAILYAMKYSRNNLVIVERYVSGYEVSVNGYIVNNEVKFLLVSDRETWPQHEGLIHKHIIDFQKEFPTQSIKKSVEAHLNALKISNGPFYAQMKIENDAAFMIEITPRFDGCHMHKLIKYATGVDLLEQTFNHLIENIEPNLQMQQRRSVTLEFQCFPPNEMINYDCFDKRTEYLEYQPYYKSGDVVRPVNGVYEKVGYYIYD